MTDSPEDREPPRLQDTTERSALPLPLPGSDEPAPAEPEAPAAADPPAPTESSAADTLPVAGEPDEPEPAEEPAPAEDPAPADKSAAVEEPSHGSSNGSAAPPPYEPPAPALGAATAHEGPSPEVLIGAAFLGGLALALLIRRLGH
jgi:hypothetical protein